MVQDVIGCFSFMVHAMIEVNFPCQFGNIKGLCWGKDNPNKILALHGWLDNAASFCELAPLLASKGYEVVAIDFAGHGHSDHKAPGHFVHFIDYVLDVQEIMNQLNWQRPILLGHSMGAAMAHLYAATTPETIDKLIMIENIGPVPSYESGTAADNLKEALKQWQNHSLKHKHFYPNVETALKARIKATPMPESILKPMIARGLKKAEKGYHWRTDKRLRLRSLFRLSEEIVQDMLSAKKPPTQLILATPTTYALSYSQVEQRIKTLAADEVIELAGHHHLHMDNSEAVFSKIHTFLNK